MTMERKDVEKVAKLARLDLDSERTARMTRQLDQILEYMRSLDEIPTLDPVAVPPTAHIIDVGCPLRPDRARAAGVDEDIDEAILAGAPGRRDRFFTVPKVIE